MTLLSLMFLLHSRECQIWFSYSARDNYGFVTYQNRDEAYFAVEHGNDDPKLPRYDLCFGGRRAFCKVSYSDLGEKSGAVPTYFV